MACNHPNHTVLGQVLDAIKFRDAKDLVDWEERIRTDRSIRREFLEELIAAEDWVIDTVCQEMPNLF